MTRDPAGRPCAAAAVPRAATADYASEARQLEERAAAARSQSARLLQEAAAADAAAAEEAAAATARGRQRSRELREQAAIGDRQATADDDRIVLLRRAEALNGQLADAAPDDEISAELVRVLDLLDPTRPEARQAVLVAQQAAEARAAAEPAPRIFGRMND